MSNQTITSKSNPDLVSVELSSRRTGMSFQRTRMSTDRTLMSVIRTSLSLLSFGFTIAQAFEKLKSAGAFAGSNAAPRNFGLALVSLGVAMLVVGIVYHLLFMLELRRTRHEMTAEGLIHGQSRFPVSYTLIVAVLLLCVGLAAVASIAFHVGPLE